MRSRGGFDSIKNFKVVDDYTVEMELARAYTPFIWAWQNMHIVPQHILGGEADINSSAFNAKPIGTGLYTLKTRVAGSHSFRSMNAAIASVSRPNTSAAESVYPSSL